MSQLLLGKIETVRRKQTAVAVASTLGMLVAAAVGMLALEMLLDWWLDMPRAVRAVFFAADLGVLGWIAWRHALEPIFYGPDDDRIALQVEEAEPEFRHRLISSVQLGRPEAVPAGASVSLVREMIAQTESLAQRVDFSRVVKIDRLIRLVVTGAAALLLGLGALALGSTDNVSIDLLKRAFLSGTPVPRKTHVEVLSGDMKLARGDSLEIRARAKGVVPLSGTLSVEGASGRRQDFLMNPADDDKTVFVCKLDNVQESMTYAVRLNDGKSDDFQVTVLTRPTVSSVEVQQVYPAYTQLGTVTRSLGDLTILRGSRLLLKVTANHEVSRSIMANVVHLVGGPVAQSPESAGQRVVLKDIGMNVDAGDAKVLTADLELPAGTTGFSINLVDNEGLRSRDPVVYRVDLVPDKAPTVRITYPELREEPVTPSENHRINYDAADDFGLRKVWLKYKVDGGAEQSKVLASPTDDKSLRGRYDWDLSSVDVPAGKPSLEGSGIEYWVEVQDNNDVSGPGRGASEHYTLKVVSQEELRQYIYSQLNQTIEGVKRGGDDMENIKDKVGELTTRPSEQQNGSKSGSQY